MAYLPVPQRYETQHDVLAEVLPDSYFPEHPVAALNKRLKTNQKVIVRAINELLTTLNTLDNTTKSSVNQTLDVFGDFLKNTQLKEDLEKIAPSAIDAIMQLHIAIFGEDLEHPVELNKCVAELLSEFKLEIPENGLPGQYLSLNEDNELIWVNTPSAVSSVAQLTDVNLNTLMNNNVLRYNSITKQWNNKDLNDVYLQKIDTEARFDRLFIGDKTTNTNKYIYADIGNSIATSSPSLRYAIDDPVAKIGHWEFSNDGEIFNALGQMELITDIKTFDNVAHNSNVIVNITSAIDSSFHRLVTVYCKEIDPENNDDFVWTLYPSASNFEGIGFNIYTYLNRTVIKNNTGSTKDIKVLIQYIAPNIINNTADIVDTNGYLTLFKNFESKSTSENQYTLLYTDTFFANFTRHSSILHIGIVEKVSALNSYGKCKIEITDGINTVVKELGFITSVKQKHTDVKLDCSFLNGFLKKWTIKIYGTSTTNNNYTIERYVVKTKPNNIAMEDFIINRDINLQTASKVYYQLDTFSFFGGYKVMPNSYFYAVIDYDVIGNITDASVQLIVTSGNASQTTTQQLDLSNNLIECRIKCPVLLENFINFKLSAKVTSEGSIKINTYHIYVEM